MDFLWANLSNWFSFGVGVSEKFLIRALQILQNKASRSVTRLGIYTPVKTLLNQCGWLSVRQLVFFHTVVLLYKTLQSGSPEYLFSMTGRDYNYKTRAKDAGKLRIVPEYKLDHDLNLKSFRWRSIRSWNQLHWTSPASPALTGSKSRWRPGWRTTLISTPNLVCSLPLEKKIVS